MRALSLGSVIAVGVLAGQMLGGLLVDATLAALDGPPVSLVNVPIGAVLLIASAALLPETPPANSRGRPGRAAHARRGGPAPRHPACPWPRGRVAGVGVRVDRRTVVALAAFVLVEQVVARRGGAPLIPGRILRAPGMLPALASLALGMAAYAGFLFSFAQHLQVGLAESRSSPV